ncbi:hypothetical protein [Nocardiopsis oceani]
MILPLSQPSTAERGAGGKVIGCQGAEAAPCDARVGAGVEADEDREDAQVHGGQGQVGAQNLVGAVPEQVQRVLRERSA